MMGSNERWGAGAVVLAIALAGCGDDGSVGPGDAGGDGAVASLDSGAPADAGGPGDAGGPDDAGVTGEWAALVRGALFTDDLDMAQERHDMLAGGGMSAAMAAGDFAHDPFLGTALLGTTENAFLAIDRWRDPAAMQGFYSDPTFAAAFATLFSGAPSLELFERTDWHQWGDLDAADASDPRFYVVVRGHLALETEDANRAAHDPIAMGGEAMVRAAGDVAHVVYLRIDDPRELFVVDVWTSDAAIEAVYTNPDFAAAFGTLFDAAPSVSVYASTDWVQW